MYKRPVKGRVARAAGYAGRSNKIGRFRLFTSRYIMLAARCDQRHWQRRFVLKFVIVVISGLGRCGCVTVNPLSEVYAERGRHALTYESGRTRPGPGDGPLGAPFPHPPAGEYLCLGNESGKRHTSHTVTGPPDRSSLAEHDSARTKLCLKQNV
ncbi:hypothetical protein EVAR_98327_1 [Eumeta japonica]|uniref:Uncharacterized protein n=1 Tax=Eumeta variegata TaxID=151549 RepID=A0A4C1XBG3_EUMVA|nr:hypothetical protein EVAR_98327_1 [Eumeta japonica]